MIKLACKIPIKVAVAVSGGRDSMACLDFLRKGKKEITVLHFNHGTKHAVDAESTVKEYCSRWKIPLEIGSISGEPSPGQSMEDFWRKSRYEWFESTGHNVIVTCHHLDDAVEWWIMTSLKGNPKAIPIRREKFIRPFLSTTRDDLVWWARKEGIQWSQDPSNDDTDYDRNYIRHTMMSHVLRINPGIRKTVLGKVMERFREESAKSR